MDSFLQALVAEIEQNQTKLDECQTHSKQYCTSVKVRDWFYLFVFIYSVANILNCFWVYSLFSLEVAISLWRSKLSLHFFVSQTNKNMCKCIVKCQFDLISSIFPSPKFSFEYNDWTVTCFTYLYCSCILQDYELQLMTYRAFVESTHKSPVKRRRMHSSSDAITQEVRIKIFCNFFVANKIYRHHYCLVIVSGCIFTVYGLANTLHSTSHLDNPACKVHQWCTEETRRRRGGTLLQYLCLAWNGSEITSQWEEVV